ncbi:uncharacterized protein LOC130614064 [Hydractinia symbiolongicarpus]|uniref:uncharacterized protein LOC130614064 n=1 Tax=Hydractinia symbiolongicarpus TaxID=13093 RepID=UPI0025500A35|nr:uncharacterized protein LOC130614064 [Hydractinia symbiolongicarpus]
MCMKPMFIYSFFLIKNCVAMLIRYNFYRYQASSTTEEEIDEEEDDFQKIAPAAIEQKNSKEDEDEEPIKILSITVPKVKNIKKQRATVVSRQPLQSNDNFLYIKKQFEGVFKKLNEIFKQQEHIYQNIKLLENSLTYQKIKQVEMRAQVLQHFHRHHCNSHSPITDEIRYSI